MSVATTWADLEAWFALHAPRALGVFRSAASGTDIAACEAAVHRALPSDLRDVLKLHDGQQIPPFVSTVAGFMLLPCKGIADAWTEYADLLDAGDLARRGESANGTAKPVWWSKEWIPFAEGAGGDLLCVDLDPGPAGIAGQVLRFWHDEPWRQQVAPSVGALLEQYLAELRHGKYHVGSTGGVELA